MMKKLVALFLFLVLTLVMSLSAVAETWLSMDDTFQVITERCGLDGGNHLTININSRKEGYAEFSFSHDGASIGFELPIEDKHGAWVRKAEDGTTIIREDAVERIAEFVGCYIPVDADEYFTLQNAVEELYEGLKLYDRGEQAWLELISYDGQSFEVGLIVDKEEVGRVGWDLSEHPDYLQIDEEGSLLVNEKVLVLMEKSIMGYHGDIVVAGAGD